MFNGPGKYDDQATRVREETSAAGVVLIVIGGDKGPGFSVQGSAALIASLPQLLEEMAESIRRQLRDD